MPAAGPGASDVLRLLRPAASRSVDVPAVEPTQQQSPTTQLRKTQPRKMSAIAAASFSMSAATLEAAAVSVFGASYGEIAPTAKSKAAEGLLGISCTIGTCGEVRAY